MVAAGRSTMGNGSIKAPQAEDNSVLTSCDTEAPEIFTEVLRMRVTRLEAELEQRDRDFKAQRVQLDLLQKQLDSKVSQIHKLQDALGYNSHSQDVSNGGHHGNRRFSAINRTQPSFQQVALEVHRRIRAKEGVSAEPTPEDFCRPTRTSSSPTQKDPQTKRLIGEALMNNEFLKELDPAQLREMVDCMYQKVFSEEQLVIQEGRPGNYLYVLTEGLLEVVQSGKLLGQMLPGTAFGELAVLYNCKRTATVRAVSRSVVWALDRLSFQSIMMRSSQARNDKYFSFLRSVSLLKELPEEKLARVVDCLEVDYYEKGEFIIREGEEGDTFFIIAKGQVIVTQTTEGFTEPQEIKTLTVGDYFGEKALISEDVRSANIICDDYDTQCLVLDRDNFNQIVGTYEELQSYLKSYVEELSRSDEKRNALPQSPAVDPAEVSELRRLRDRLALISPDQPLDQLQLIATLGMGGFGRVELVKLKDEERTFALKCIKKQHIVENRQQQHIFSEKTVLQQTDSPFIVRFFRTFRDQKYVYLLLEACLGGELWTVLRDMSFFDEPTARFCTGCVLEAFEYLHNKNILYRDLKPENLLLDQSGYIKLTDFGFAKRVSRGRKTWTFCGTPEYVAPEIIMNRGHDTAVDLWALGILIFELLTGNPPFSGSDPIKIYTSILHGIDKVDFPKRVRKRADDLIRRLCRLNPVERLGNKKSGIIEIKKHKWFQGFNWEGLERHKLPSPLKREIKGPTDHSHFDVFPLETGEPLDELSGWDQDF